MKHILLTILFIFMLVPAVFATPDYDYSQDTAKVVVYGVEEAKYNKELYDRLYNAFIKKYTDENGSFSPPVNAYAVEVLEEFNRQKKFYEH